MLMHNLLGNNGTDFICQKEGRSVQKGSQPILFRTTNLHMLFSRYIETIFYISIFFEQILLSKKL